MNKKILTGFMLVLTAGVWGYVGLQFFSGQGGDEEEVLPEETAQEQRPVLHFKQEELLLNYSDPFLKEEARPAIIPVKNSQAAPVKPMPVKKEEKIIPPAYTWPNIVYKGLIQNKNQPEKLIGVIVINGQERIVRKGEKINELSVASIERNKVELAYEKEKKVFVK